MSISLEEFLIAGDAQRIVDMESLQRQYHRNEKTKYLTENGLSVEWRTGGRSGGSCWDDGTKDNHYEIGGDDEPEFKQLDSLFEEFCPNITFLQYKNIMSKCVKSYEYSMNEYYGNYTKYKVKWVCLEEIYNKLVEKNLI